VVNRKKQKQARHFLKKWLDCGVLRVVETKQEKLANFKECIKKFYVRFKFLKKDMLFFLKKRK